MSERKGFIFGSKFLAIIFCMGIGAACFCPAGFAAEKNISMESCLSEKIAKAPDDMTVGQMRAECNEEMGTVVKKGVVNQRVQIDRENILKPFTLMAHRQNYILLAAHNFSGYSNKEFIEAFGDDGYEADDTEVQFQLSIKMPLAVDMFDTDVDIFAAYTVRSFWQLFNDETTPGGTDISSPFRETNHEPEIWVQTNPDFDIFGFDLVNAAAGFVHQSNGRATTLSRSWNRVFANFIFQNGNLAVGIKPWFRIEEDSEDDDNPDIDDYLGHGQITLAYKWDDHVFTLMSRNNIESGFSEGALEAGWSFPLWGFPYLKGYVQWFSGYGESLIDYDNYVNRLGVGLILTDLL